MYTATHLAVPDKPQRTAGFALIKQKRLMHTGAHLVKVQEGADALAGHVHECHRLSQHHSLAAQAPLSQRRFLLQLVDLYVLSPGQLIEQLEAHLHPNTAQQKAGLSARTQGSLLFRLVWCYIFSSSSSWKPIYAPTQLRMAACHKQHYADCLKHHKRRRSAGLSVEQQQSYFADGKV